MFNVTPLSEALEITLQRFMGFKSETEMVALDKSLGRVLSSPITFKEFIPNFNRSTVDGYALRSEDVRGCSESTPGILRLLGSIDMGKPNHLRVGNMDAVFVPTGAELPEGADSVVMLEYTEKFSEDEIAVLRPSAPGANIIFRGDDGKPGVSLLPLGHCLGVADIGSLAALGYSAVEAYQPLKIGILSTGDELVPPHDLPGPGQIRDVNTAMLGAFAQSVGFEPLVMPFIADQEDLLEKSIQQLIKEADCVLVSGGTSVGVRDNLARVIERLGSILIHGLAVKPGKPTIIGNIEGKPVFGLPGNPVAAYFIAKELVLPLLMGFMHSEPQRKTLPANLSTAFSSNQGREEFVLVHLEDGQARPLPSKSGLITAVSRANGYIRIPRDSEGLSKGAEVNVILL
ncbi:MAG: gephyrin-like molybdotransferase Glp [Anaerolineaceae bacterium]|nr:gephyrin-like molybdotransferase Glp [Anaerolineaceae bacterium]